MDGEKKTRRLERTIRALSEENARAHRSSSATTVPYTASAAIGAATLLRSALLRHKRVPHGGNLSPPHYGDASTFFFRFRSHLGAIGLGLSSLGITRNRDSSTPHRSMETPIAREAGGGRCRALARFPALPALVAPSTVSKLGSRARARRPPFLRFEGLARRRRWHLLSSFRDGCVWHPKACHRRKRCFPQHTRSYPRSTLLPGCRGLLHSPSARARSVARSTFFSSLRPSAMPQTTLYAPHLTLQRMYAIAST